MINENSFLNKEQEEKMEKKRTKEEAQVELQKKFELRKTSDFQLALQNGKIELAQEWLNYIAKNKESFPQYLANWDSWYSDRQKDIKLYQRLKKNGSLEKMEHRTKEEAQAELQEKFGFRDTKGFRVALKQGDINTAKNGLNYLELRN